MLTTTARPMPTGSIAPCVVEAPVLDRDDRVAHHGRDLVPVHEHAVLVGAQDAEHGLAVVGVDHAVRLLRELGDLELRQILRERGHEAVDERDDAERQPGQHGDREARLAQPHAAPRRRRRRILERKRRWGRRRRCHGRFGSGGRSRARGTLPAGREIPDRTPAAQTLLVSASARAELREAPVPAADSVANDPLALRFAWRGRIVYARWSRLLGVWSLKTQ